jgi:molybdopterin-guanine dinucleotide biosynthesis protein A
VKSDHDRLPISGAILVGGQSTRMGRDKATLELGGMTLAARQAAVLTRCCDEVLLVGAAARGLPGCRSVPDAHPRRCALTGLYSALLAAAAPLVFVTACDYPFLGIELVRALYRAWQPGMLSLLPLGPEGRHPLTALHHRDLAPRLRAALDAGRLRVDLALDPLRRACLPWASLRRLGVPPRTFLNLNTPAELERARRLLAEEHRCTDTSAPPC